MLGGTNTQIVASEIQEISDAAWNEFTATSPQGMDLVAEASVRRLMLSRIRRAVTRGELDRKALRCGALRGL